MGDLKHTKDQDGIVTITVELADTSFADLSDNLEAIVTKLEQDDIAGILINIEQDADVAVPALETAQETFDQINAFKKSLRRLEIMGKPVVATISTSTLGLSYELALAAHLRIAINNQDIKVGLPQVRRGTFPGCGGIARSVFMLGFERALPLLLEGDVQNVEKAVETGLVDEVAENSSELISKAKDWIKANPEAVQTWDVKGYKMPGGAPTNPKHAPMLFTAPAMLRKQTKGLSLAPEVIMAATVECAIVDISSALRIESRYFVDLLHNPHAKGFGR